MTGKCENCAKKATCKKEIGFMFGYCNIDFEPVRTFHGVTVFNKDHIAALNIYLRDKGFYFEPSGCYDGVHFEIKCTNDEYQTIDNMLTALEGGV